MHARHLMQDAPCSVRNKVTCNKQYWCVGVQTDLPPTTMAPSWTCRRPPPLPMTTATTTPSEARAPGIFFSSSTNYYLDYAPSPHYHLSLQQ